MSDDAAKMIKEGLCVIAFCGLAAVAFFTGHGAAALALICFAIVVAL